MRFKNEFPIHSRHFGQCTTLKMRLKLEKMSFVKVQLCVKSVKILKLFHNFVDLTFELNEQIITFFTVANVGRSKQNSNQTPQSTVHAGGISQIENGDGVLDGFGGRIEQNEIHSFMAAESSAKFQKQKLNRAPTTGNDTKNTTDNQRLQ